MTIIPFDTLACAKKLKQSGIAENHAEALTETMSQVFETKNVATKQDIKILEASTKQDIKALEASTTIAIKNLEASTKVSISESKTETIKWVAGMMMVQTGVIVSALMALFKMFSS